jgi:hypothetical protein
LILCRNEVIKIYYKKEDPLYDYDYELNVSKKENMPIRISWNWQTADCVNLTKSDIPEIFNLEVIESYSEEPNTYIMTFNNVEIIFTEQSVARFWFKIFCTVDFDNMSLDDIKELYPENFV